MTDPGFHLLIAPDSPKSAWAGLNRLARERVRKNPPRPEIDLIRSPVGLLFVRGDTTGKEAGIAQQMKASAEFLHERTGDAIDFLLAGWRGSPANLTFDPRVFQLFLMEIEEEQVEAESS